MYQLRDYQKEAVKRILTFFKNSADSNFKHRAGISVAPVGSGKSLIIGGVAAAFDKPLLVLQPSVELLYQNYEKLTNLGGTATIYSASAGIKEVSHLVYATLGSVKRAIDDLKKYGVEYVIIDEAHKGYSPKKSGEFYKFLKTLNPKAILGLTATPLRLVQLSNNMETYSTLVFITKRQGKDRPVFKKVVDIVQVSRMIEGDYWSPLIYETHDFDAHLELNSTGSDFTKESIMLAVDSLGIPNKILLSVNRLLDNGRRNILVFTDSVDTAKDLAGKTRDSAVVFSGMPMSERKNIIERFKNGDIKVVYNYGILTTGFDHPELDAVILGRPTNSYGMYYQMVGRGVRKHPNKTDCLIVDFSGNVERFGKLEDMRIEKLPKMGWQVTSGDNLVTGYNLKLPPPSRSLIIKNAELEKFILKKDKKQVKFWFGKHKGKALKEVPTGYLQWLFDKLKKDPDKSEKFENLFWAIRDELNKRAFKLFDK